MKMITLTRGRTCVVDDDDYAELMKHSWSFSNGGYAKRGTRVSGKITTVCMHRQVMDAPFGYEVDHINHDKLDNRRENLRICTRGQNVHNYVVMVSNTSGYKGVHWHKVANKWQARIRINYTRINLGLFINKDDAARAYNEAAIRLHGEFAVLNKLKGEVE